METARAKSSAARGDGRAVVLLLTAVLIGLIVSATAIIGVLQQRASADAINHLWEQTADQLLSRVTQQVRMIYEPGRQFAQYSEHMVGAGRLDATDVSALHEHFEAVIDSSPTIVWASYGRADGAYISVYRWPVGDDWRVRRTHRTLQGEQTRFFEQERNSSGEWTTIRDELGPRYDPRDKSWWSLARTAGERGRWTDPVTFFSRRQLGFIYTRASYEPGTKRMRGAWAAEFEAEPVADFLSRLQTLRGTRVYVVHRNGAIVARPDGPVVGDAAISQASDAGDSLLAAAWAASSDTRAGEAFELEEHVAMYRDLPPESGLPLRVILTVPREALFTRTRHQSQRAIIVAAFSAVLALLLTIALAVGLNRLIGERVRRAVDALRVGQYTLKEKLNSGGMGEVYIAEHALLRRPTAVKLLRPDRTRPEDLERFEAEVQATCALSHPNTVRVYDYGHSPDGGFYYAMELVDGLSLRQLLELDGPLAVGRAIFIAAQVCSALAEAHDAGLIHRDIKPANVLLTRVGDRADFVKVVDFGLVKRVDDDREITRDGGFAGTPGFLAPEVPTSHGVVGPVTDVYSVGALTYVLVTGSMPFDGESGMDVFINQQTHEPTPITEVMQGHIDDDLATVVMRCLSRDPAARPASARELREALLRCRAADTWSEHDARNWWDERDAELAAQRAETRERLPLGARLGKRL